MNKVSKATRATIKLGDIELDVFQLPDGSYAYSKTDIESSLGFEATRRAYRDFLKSKDSKATQAKELVSGNIKLKYMSKTYTLVSQKEVTLFWSFQAQNGNLQALALLTACAEEALERRADKAFDVARSEEEYNQRLEQRLKGKATRRTLTDAIKSYIETHNLQDTNYAKFIYSNVSDRLNLGIFNRRSHRLKEDWDLKPTENIRDHLNKDELRWLEQCEDLAMRLIDLDAFEPLTAMNEAIERLRIPSVRR